MTQIEKTFDLPLRHRVVEKLQTSKFPHATSNLDRIHLAIIHLSRGNYDRFELAISEAQQDWRDILVAAGLGYDNWKDVLKSRGIDFW